MPSFAVIKTVMVFLLFLFIINRSQAVEKDKKSIIILLWAVCLIVVSWLTLFRSPILSEKTAMLIPFRSYYSIITSNWVAHGKYVLRENIANFILFLPVGALAFHSFRNPEKKKMLFIVFAVCAFLSVGIELIQYHTLIGTFEADDIIHNVAGGLFGYLITDRIDKSN